MTNHGSPAEVIPILSGKRFNCDAPQAPSPYLFNAQSQIPQSLFGSLLKVVHLILVYIIKPNWKYIGGLLYEYPIKEPLLNRFSFNAVLHLMQQSSFRTIDKT